jgi:hypothetical protein
MPRRIGRGATKAQAVDRLSSSIWRSLRSGQNINVDERGIVPPKHPLRSGDATSYVFGGSTVGYGVPDWATIPTYIQEHC